MFLCTSRFLTSTNNSQNYGIVVAFGILFLAALLFFTEYNTSFSINTSRVLFKRRSNKPLRTATNAGDMEKGSSETVAQLPEPTKTEKKDAVAQESIALQPSQTDIFSWQHIQYTVPTANGPRRLLDDISGYVMPGKLTALMGESGAGKASHHSQKADD